jgi:tetratricopeptide (TPR) repeat protein
VFGGRWPLEVAEEVCRGDGIEPEQVPELLLHLVDKSLVVAEEASDGRHRYRLLDTLRQYGREQLLADGGSEAVQRQHASYYLALSERADPELNQPRQAAWIDRLAFAEGELWAALERLAARGEIQDALRLAAVLGRFWLLRGHLQEGRRRLATVLALPGAEAPTLARARVLEAAGALALYQGDVPATRTLFRESLALYRAHDHQPGVAWVLFYLGWMCHDYYRGRAARRFLGESLARFRLLEDRRGVARALNALGLVAMVEDELDQACRLHEESLALSREVGDRWAIAWALTNLGVDRMWLAKLGRGEAHTVHALFEEGLEIWHDLGERRHLAFSHMNMADCAMLEGDLTLAGTRLDQSLAMFTDLEDVNGLFFAVSVGARLWWAEGRHEASTRLIGATYGRTKARTGKAYALKDSLTQQILAEARTLLGADLFEQAWSDGCAMSLPEAVAYLRQDLNART